MHTLDETIEISGEWWLAEKPEMVISGLLYFNSQGIELHLNQAFTPPNGAIRPGDLNPKYAVVHGVTIKGEAVTLFDSQQIGTSFHFGSGGFKQPGRIYARALAFGAHIPADFQFLRVSFRVPGLQVWLGKQVIAHTITFDEEQKFTTQSFGLGRMPDETFRVCSIDSTLSWHYGWSSKADAFKSIRVDVSAWFSLQPDEGKTIDWFLGHHETLLTMLSFLSGHPLVADAIQAKFDESDHRADILVVTRKTEHPEQNYPIDFFLSRPTITAPLEEYCNKWFEIAPTVEKAASLARSVMASKDLWLHVEFLSLMQALEGLHRALYDGKYIEDSQYETVKAALTNAIPSSVQRDHKDALKSRIRYGNQISLRKRLDELTSKLSPQSRADILGNSGNVPKSWIDTRNYYTHWDDELLTSVLNSQSMYYANVRMHHFIRVLYAQLIGIDAVDIENAFKRPSRLAQQLVHLNIVEKRQTDPSYIPQAIMTISSEGNSDKGENTTGDVSNTHDDFTLD
jgi:hypothetical protein